MPELPLYRSLIDYAGVFPPAALSVADALADYRAHRDGPHGWMLGPILLRATQIAAADLTGLDGRVGVVADGPVPEGVHPAQVEAVVDPDDVIPPAVALAGGARVLYLESSDPARVSDLVVKIAEVRDAGGPVDVRAKIRTGGADAAAFPSAEVLAAFLLVCADHRVPCKATAGLHEPFRHESTAAAGATEHGFVNVLAAARAAVAGEDEAVVNALVDTDPSSFDAASGAWKEVGSAVPDEQVRELFRSYGSCSFAEPIDHLVELGVLEAAQ